MFVCLIALFDVCASCSVLFLDDYHFSVVFTNRKMDHVYTSAYFIQSYQITDDDYERSLSPIDLSCASSFSSVASVLLRKLRSSCLIGSY
jgi:hypothetical protein